MHLCSLQTTQNTAGAVMGFMYAEMILVFLLLSVFGCSLQGELGL